MQSSPREPQPLPRSSRPLAWLPKSPPVCTALLQLSHLQPLPAGRQRLCTTVSAPEDPSEPAAHPQAPRVRPLSSSWLDAPRAPRRAERYYLGLSLSSPLLKYVSPSGPPGSAPDALAAADLTAARQRLPSAAYSRKSCHCLDMLSCACSHKHMLSCALILLLLAHLHPVDQYLPPTTSSPRTASRYGLSPAPRAAISSAWAERVVSTATPSRPISRPTSSTALHDQWPRPAARSSSKDGHCLSLLQETQGSLCPSRPLSSKADICRFGALGSRLPTTAAARIA